MGSKKQALVKKRHQENKRVKAKPAVLAERQRTAVWQNRMVGHGFEAPDQLLANPKNWRIHPEAQKLALKGMLDTVGWVGQVLVNRRTGFLVDGHLRVMVALEKNEPVVPVAYVDLSDDEEALVLTTLDPIAALAGTDKEKLGALIAGAHSESADVMAMLERLARTQGVHLVNRPCPEPQPDRADELMRKWGVADGDLWQIGPHRLLCGDCTNAGVVADLTDGMPAPVLMATDPPYGVSYDPLWREEALPAAARQGARHGAERRPGGLVGGVSVLSRCDRVRLACGGACGGRRPTPRGLRLRDPLADHLGQAAPRDVAGGVSLEA